MKRRILLVFLLASFLFSPLQVFAVNFSFRIPVEINSTNPDNLSNYQVYLTMDTASLISLGRMNADCSDLRFTNSTSFNSDDWLLNYPYWIQEDCNTTGTKIYVKLDLIPANSVLQIYSYYGNTTPVSNQSNGESVFPFFDEFNDGSINTTLWDNTTGVTETNGVLWVNGTGSYSYLDSNSHFDVNTCFMSRFQASMDNGNVIGFMTDPLFGDASPIYEYFMYSYPTTDALNYVYYNSETGGSNLNNGVGWQTGSLCRNGTTGVVINMNRTSDIINNTFTDSTALRIAQYSFTNAQYIESDWIAVRNYSSPEPTAQIFENNEPLNISSVFISPSGTITPGTTFYVAATVDDQNGKTDISSINMSCVGTDGTEWNDSWDSIKLLNTSEITWTSVNDTAYLVNGTFSSSVNYWSTKSINGTWTCKVYAKESSGSSLSNSANMTVDTSAGITIGSSGCAFDNAVPGDTDKQWKCPADGTRNNTITHNGNVDINVTINGTNLVGENDSSWIIWIGNITWNATFFPDGDSLSGNVLSTSATNLISQWKRGSFPIFNATNITAWLNYPKPLKYQPYNGTITLTAMAVG